MGEAYWSLANLKTVPFSASEEDAMRSLLAGAELSDEDRLHLHYALGKALEDRGEFAASLEHYATGARLRAAQLSYDADDTHARMTAGKALFTKAFFAARTDSGSASEAPIFILGLPRSGSTLIEQILASHSAVEGTMELPDIAAIARELGAPAAARPQHPIRSCWRISTRRGSRRSAKTTWPAPPSSASLAGRGSSTRCRTTSITSA